MKKLSLIVKVRLVFPRVRLQLTPDVPLVCIKCHYITFARISAPRGALLQPATRVAVLLPVCRASQTASGGHVHITNPPPRASLPTWQ